MMIVPREEEREFVRSPYTSVSHCAAIDQTVEIDNMILDREDGANSRGADIAVRMGHSSLIRVHVGMSVAPYMFESLGIECVS